MKIYKDRTLRTEVGGIDFGVVEAGESKTITYFLLNDTGTRVINLEIAASNKEILVGEYPKNLDKGAVVELKLTWKSSLNVKAGLKAVLDIKGAELWS